MVVYEVVAYGRWSLTRSGRYERVDCSSCASHSVKFLVTESSYKANFKQSC